MSAPFVISRLLDAPRERAAVADLFRAPGG